MESIVELYEKNGFKVAKTAGTECYGPCPVCGGKDRFIMWNDDNGERFWCRKCGIAGGAMKLVRILKNRDAYAAMQGDAQAPNTATPKHAVSSRKKRLDPPPSPITYQPYLDFAEKFAGRIGHTIAEKMLEKRGLTVDTARKYGLGFSDGDTWYVPSGREKPNRFPAGIVIPNRRSGTLRSLKVRCLCGDVKYMTMSGCPQMPFIIK